LLFLKIYITGGIGLKLFHLVLRRDGQNDWMKIDVLGKDGRVLEDDEKLIACLELGKIMMGETSDSNGREFFLPDGEAHSGYFREHLAGLAYRKLYEIRIAKDMVPKLLFRERYGHYNDEMVLSFVPDRIEMVMVRNDRTEIIIRV